MKGKIKLNLCCLTDRQKEAFVMYKKGASAREIAETLKISRIYVYKLIQKAIEKLYKYYYNKDKWTRVLHSKLLSRRRKRLLRLWKIECLSTKEIAEVMGIKERSVIEAKMQIRRKLERAGIIKPKNIDSDSDPVKPYSEYSDFDINLPIYSEEEKTA